MDRMNPLDAAFLDSWTDRPQWTVAAQRRVAVSCASGSNARTTSIHLRTAGRRPSPCTSGTTTSDARYPVPLARARHEAADHVALELVPVRAVRRPTDLDPAAARPNQPQTLVRTVVRHSQSIGRAWPAAKPSVSALAFQRIAPGALLIRISRRRSRPAVLASPSAAVFCPPERGPHGPVGVRICQSPLDVASACGSDGLSPDAP